MYLSRDPENVDKQMIETSVGIIKGCMLFWGEKVEIFTEVLVNSMEKHLNNNTNPLFPLMDIEF